MLSYRICRAEYAADLKASGSAGRWNHDGQWILYSSATRSLAALEMLARRSGQFLNNPYKVMVLEVPVDSCQLLLPESLPDHWKQISSFGHLREIGAEWYRRSESLVLSVPSVLIPQERNYLINTQHPDFGEMIRLVEVEEFDWDGRLVL
ncbi:MAG TPA: RES family NAD+ phosphorylase [Bacteroidales bacterium]|nr:RES family NAD+ phosphorylase [Bacteroidales bacterium]